MKLNLLILFSCFFQLRAQSFIPNCTPPTCSPTNASPCAAVYVDASMPIANLYWVYNGAGMDCAWPGISDGPVILRLTWIEPNKTGSGQRVMRVRVNDGLPFLVDVFQATGAVKRLLEVPVLVDVHGQSGVRLSIRAQAGNVMLSDVKITSLSAVDSSTIQWAVLSFLECGIPTTATSDCSNIYYLKIQQLGGALRSFLAIPEPIQ